MTTASEHGRNLLAAIIPGRRDLLDRALRHLTPEHFTDVVQANLFRMLERYAEVTGAIIPRDMVADLLVQAGKDTGSIALHLETYDLLAAHPAEDSDFRWSLERLRELAAERATGAALTQAMQILTRGLETEHGELLTGHSASRNHLLHRFAEIDRTLSMQEAPEGDMGTEGDAILAEYAAGEAARLSGRQIGVEFGIDALDHKINGLQPGDLGLVVAYSGEGKTHACVQLAWNAAVMQGRNVVFFTTETIRSVVRRRLIARHSRLHHFGLPTGLNSRDLKNFTLTDEQKLAFAQVVKDSDNNPAYGKRYIAQVPRSSTVASVESKLVRLQRMFPIDLVILDSLYLLRPEKRRNTDREELSGMLKEAKQLATTFNDGAGVPIISPWQVSRSARQEAERTGYYTSQALSETAEATNSSDIIISLLAPLDNDKRYVTLKMQLMKQRDGERDNSIEVDIDYGTSTFSPRGGNTRTGELDDLMDGDVFGL